MSGTWAIVVHKAQNTRKPWTVRYEIDGERHEKSFTTKREATNYQAEVTHRANTGTWIDPAMTRESFHDAAERWIRNRVVTEQTTHIYTSALRNYLDPAIGDMPMDRLARDRGRVQELLTSELPARGLSASTIRTCKTVIMGTVTEAIANGRLARSAGAIVFGPKLRLPQPKRRTDVFFPTADQLSDLARELGQPYGRLVWIMRGTGLRIGEALAIRHENVRDGMLRVTEQVNTKGEHASLKARREGDFRDVPCPAYVADAIGQGTGYVFPPIPRATLDYRFRHARDAAGLPSDFTWHSLRHVYASVALSQGIPLLDVSRYLGHRSISVTADLYGHLVPVASERARNVLDAEHAEFTHPE
jgi:integrase